MKKILLILLAADTGKQGGERRQDFMNAKSFNQRSAETDELHKNVI
ncbi:MAG TPA: hypothetical protein VF258_03290 [Luteolibacter sp.]